MVGKFIKLSIGISALLCVITTAVCADTRIIIEGSAEGLVTIPNTEEFLVKDNMLPGDVVEGAISLQNNYTKTYDIFLRAESPSGDKDFIDKLNLNIYIDDTLDYKGTLDSNDLSKDIKIATLKPGESKELYAEVEFSGTAGNEFKNRNAEVEWIFTAYNYEDTQEEPDKEEDKEEDNSIVIDSNPDIENKDESQVNKGPFGLPETGNLIAINLIISSIVLIITGVVILKSTWFSRRK